MGETATDRAELLEAVMNVLPKDKLRHVSGLGLPEDVLQGVAAGVDIFESTYPYMLTMGGYAMTFPFCMKTTSKGLSHRESCMEEKAKAGTDSAKINLRAVSYKLDNTPLVKGCQCYTCQKHTRAYINHLLNTHEMLAQTLLEIHNTYHYLAFFQAIRNSIKEDNFHNFRIWFTSERQDQEILALGAL